MPATSGYLTAEMGQVGCAMFAQLVTDSYHSIHSLPLTRSLQYPLPLCLQADVTSVRTFPDWLSAIFICHSPYPYPNGFNKALQESDVRIRASWILPPPTVQLPPITDRPQSLRFPRGQSEIDLHCCCMYVRKPAAANVT
jgi:hypothetical protein